MIFTNSERMVVWDRWGNNMENEYIANGNENLETAHNLLDKWIHLSGDELYRFCRRLTYSKEDADDLFQETLLTVLERIGRWNDMENSSSFLFTTALYVWKGWKRKFARRNRIAPFEPLYEEMIPDNLKMEEDVIRKEERQIVQEVVNELSERFRVPIILYYSIEMSTAEIATILELPQGTVKSRLYKARKLIEKGLEGKGYEI